MFLQSLNLQLFLKQQIQIANLQAILTYSKVTVEVVNSVKYIRLQTQLLDRLIFFSVASFQLLWNTFFLLFSGRFFTAAYSFQSLLPDISTICLYSVYLSSPIQLLVFPAQIIFGKFLCNIFVTAVLSVTPLSPFNFCKTQSISSTAALRFLTFSQLLGIEPMMNQLLP